MNLVWPGRMPPDVEDEARERARCCSFANQWLGCLTYRCVNQTKMIADLQLACTGFSSRWRVANGRRVSRRWIVWDLQFYNDTNCQHQLLPTNLTLLSFGEVCPSHGCESEGPEGFNSTGFELPASAAIASGPKPNEADYLAFRAFDT